MLTKFSCSLLVRLVLDLVSCEPFYVMLRTS